MPDPQIRGVQPLAWGTEVITGYINESQGEDDSSEHVTIDNEAGEVVTSISGFGRKTEITLEVIPKSGTTKPTTGDILSYGATPKKLEILTISSKRMSKNVEKWTIKGVRYPGIALTT